VKLLAAGFDLLLAVHLSATAAETLHVVDPHGLTTAEQGLLASAQGLLNREAPRVWVRSGGLHARVLERVRDRFEVADIPGPWALISSNRAVLSAFVTCRVRDASFNLATSLAGQRRWLVVDESLRDRALGLGLEEALDVRDAPAGAFGRHGAAAARGILVHQPVSKALHLRDLAVALGAWVDFEPRRPGDTALTDLVRSLGPRTDVLGWGSEERGFVSAVSKGGGWVLPADWAPNLSAHRWFREPGPVRRPASEPPPDPPRRGERVVAFVVSDGDNLQWLLGGFTEAPGFWSSPLRGTLPVTWEFAPQLRRWAPAADAWLRSTATPLDAFVGGPSGGGYYFPHDHPDREGIARESARLLAEAGLTVGGVLNDGGDPSEVASLLGAPAIEGVLYKDYVPYNRRRGAIHWHAGKPAVSYRHLLWEERRADGTLRPDWLPEGVAEAVRRQPDDPIASDDAYALVQVHAWSFRDRGGPLAAIRDTVRLLPPGTRVVTAPVLVRWLREHRSRR
jgi:hypothetical protein